MLILNPYIEVIDNTDNLILLRIQNEIIKITPIEYEIISAYSTNNAFYEVIKKFSHVIKIREEQLGALISKSVQNKILIEESEKISSTGLGFLGAKIRYSFKKNSGKILELFTIDLTSTLIDKIFSNTRFTRTILILLILLVTLFSIDLLVTPLNFKENYFKTLYQVPFKFSSLIGFIYLSAFVSIVFHELGHYFFYKSVNGKTTIFGFGLLFYVFPAFFTKIYSSLLKSKSNKLVVNFGGIIFDLFLIVFILYFTKHYHNQFPTISFFAYTLIISISIRLFFNLNIFLPGTDGYHILCDSINEKDLFKTSITKFKLVSKKIEPLTAKNSAYIIYLLFSFISIAISWGMFFVPIMMYFYYAS